MLTSRRVMLALFLLVVGVLMSPLGAWPPQEKTPVRRAARPKFTDKARDSIYFDNLFEQALVGERPVLGQSTSAAGNGSSQDADDSNDAGGRYAWSQWLPASVIEDEIKALKVDVDATVTTPVRFSGGAYREARRLFSELALLFAVIQEYDGEVRWKDDAAALRDAFARSAGNTKTGSPQAYNESKIRKEDLQEIVRGNQFLGTPAIEPENDWSQICDRSPLMERLQIAIDRINPAVSNESEFESSGGLLQHEAAIVAALGEVLTREGMDDAIEDEYREFAVEMRDAGQRIQAAVRTTSYESAVEAVGVIEQSCSNCHSNWQ